MSGVVEAPRPWEQVADEYLKTVPKEQRSPDHAFSWVCDRVGFRMTAVRPEVPMEEEVGRFAQMMSDIRCATILIGLLEEWPYQSSQPDVS